MATRWAIRVALAGWLVLVSLVLLLGNPTLVRRLEVSRDAYGSRFAREVLSYPEWGLPGYPSVLPQSLGIAVTLRTVLIVVVVGLLMFATARSMGPRPSGLGVTLTVWMAVVVGAGLVSALLAPAIVASDTGGVVSDADANVIDSILTAGGVGAVYGFWVGWLPALVAAPFGRRAARAARAAGPGLSPPPGPAPAGGPARY